MKKVLFLGLMYTLGGFTILASGQDPVQLPEVLKARLEYERSYVEARLKFEATTRQALDQYLRTLKSIQAERIKAGDLDNALAIKSTIERLKEENPVSRLEDQIAKSGLVMRLSKIIWSPGPGGWPDNFRFGEDGYIYSPPHKRSKFVWALLNQNMIVSVNLVEGYTDVILVDLDKGVLTVLFVGNTKNPGIRWEAKRIK